MAGAARPGMRGSVATIWGTPPHFSGADERYDSASAPLIAINDGRKLEIANRIRGIPSARLNRVCVIEPQLRMEDSQVQVP